MTIVANSGAEVAVAFATLDGRDELLLDPDKSFHAASTMKVPVMIELFRQARGRTALARRSACRSATSSTASSTAASISSMSSDDSDAEVYKAVGQTLSLRQLCEAMITVSSNFAANLLIERLGVENIKATVSRLGADGMQVLRGVEDNKAFEKGLNNTTTARGLLDPAAEDRHRAGGERTADAEMVAILKRQHFNNAIPAGLPSGIAVAHKTGNITKIHHDAAIVFGPRPYVLVVLVRGLADEGHSAELIASISREVWAAVAR